SALLTSRNVVDRFATTRSGALAPAGRGVPMARVRVSAATAVFAVVTALLTFAAPAGAATGDWPSFRHDATHSGTNPDETTIGTGNVASLTTAWTGATGNLITSSPAVANGTAYVGAYDGKLYAFDAAGVTNCSGAPTTCSPLWTGATGDYIHSSPAVS